MVGLENHILNLMTSEGISREEAEAFVKKTMKVHLQPPEFEVLAYPTPGYEEHKNISFKEFADACKTNIVTPSGRIYWHPEVRPAMMRDYTIDLGNMRDYHKARMFKFQQEEKKEEVAIERGAESKIKIEMNTITAGAKNSAYCCFADKAGFNAITATARLMIKTNYVNLEQNLGGNFYWEDLEDLTNWIMVHLKSCPPKEMIDDIISKHNLMVPSKELLLDRYQFFMNLYKVGLGYLHKTEFYNFEAHLDNDQSNQYINSEVIKTLVTTSPLKLKKEEIVDLSQIKKLLDNLEQHQITYLFYVNNFRAIVRCNEPYFRAKFERLLSTDYEQHEYPLSDIFKLDKEYPPIISTRFATEVAGKELKKIVETEPELAMKLANYANHLHENFLDIEMIFNLFCKPPVLTPRTGCKEVMWRNTTLGSDTDSVLYTLVDWMEWFNKDPFSASIEGYTFTAIIAFYVAQVAKHLMYTFSGHLGAKGKDRYWLEMKGEFDFKSMTFMAVKKHYTGVIDKQEGRVLPKLKLDIKGIGLRNAAIPKTVAELLKTFVLDSQKQQSAYHFIKETIEMEHIMAKDLRQGEKYYLKTISVQQKESYDDPGRTAYFYLEFWNYVFGEKYGEVHPPAKLPSAFLLNLTPERIQMIKQIDPKIAQKLIEFRNLHTDRKHIIGIVINPLLHRIPEELLILLDMRKHIYTNMRGMYLKLESYGIPLMHSDKEKLLLCDYYSELDLKLLASDVEDE